MLITSNNWARSLRAPQKRKLQALPTENIVTEADSPAGLKDQLGLSFGHESNALFEEQEVGLENGDNIQDSSAQPLPGRSEAIARLSSLVDQLPSQQIIEELKEVFFSQVNWYYLVLTPYFFNTMLKSWQKTQNSCGTDIREMNRDLQHFSALLFQVLANALQFLPLGTAAAKLLRIEDYAHCDRLSQEYSAIGMQIMDILGRYNPTITSAEHDMLRAAWLKCESRGKESWQAQDLGLHLQSPVTQENEQDLEETLLRLWYDEHKRRLWYAMFMWDGKHYQDYGLIRRMHNDIIGLFNQLPPTVRPDSPDTSFDKECPFLPLQRQCASSIGQAFLMALHRPHMAQHEESRQAAIKAALDCLQAQQALFDVCGEQFYKMYTLSFYTIEPSIFLSATALGSEALDRVTVESILAAVGQGITRFTMMKRRSTIARSGLPILSNCYQKLSKKIIELNSLSGMPNDTSNDVQLSSEPNATWLSEQDLGPMDFQQIDQIPFETDLFLPPDTLDYLATIEQFDPSTLTVFPDDGDIASSSWTAP
ncbi:MAG: hypothetical protein Q9160_008539 [Pyrenula sp. 1 TL-2023]